MAIEKRVDRTLVELVDAMPKPLPQSAVTVEDSLGVPLRVTSEDAYGAIYVSQPFITSDGYKVRKVELRTMPVIPSPKQKGVGAILIIDLDLETCVPEDTLKEKFGMTRLGDPVADDPGLSSWEAVVPWGTFGLSVRTLLGGKRCVDAVVIKNSTKAVR
ncbi:hypothetical protein [Dyella terrae]|uniref:hypothetical protein n=1 Tax=Dyella terrae TaxID=522259 RepID=UPI001EFC6A56|nr:hypothetical protein [Dyella terrae]ULU25715.1 hypothetical protein DYST_02650 [Dyella terrae]